MATASASGPRERLGWFAQAHRPGSLAQGDYVDVDGPFDNPDQVQSGAAHDDDLEPIATSLEQFADSLER